MRLNYNWQSRAEQNKADLGINADGPGLIQSWWKPAQVCDVPGFKKSGSFSAQIVSKYEHSATVLWQVLQAFQQKAVIKWTLISQ